MRRRPEDANAYRRDSGVQARRVDAVSSVKDKSVRVPGREDHPDLLERRGGHRGAGDVAVHQQRAAHLERHEDVQDPERGRDRPAEVAGHEGLGVIPDEGGPAAPRPPPSPPAGHGLADATMSPAEQILGGQGGSRPETQPHELQEIDPDRRQ